MDHSTDYPTAIEDEKCLLSSVMRGGGDVRKRAVEQLSPEMFFRYEDLAYVVLTVAATARPDPDTVRSKYDGDRLGEVLDVRPAPQNVDTFIQKIREAHGSRELLGVITDEIEPAKDEAFLQVADRLQERVTRVTSENGGLEDKHISDLTDTVMGKIEERQGEIVTGIPTGFPELDKLTKGWQDAELIIPFGSTSMGKTAFVLRSAIEAATEGFSTSVLSLEMGEIPVTERMVGMEARVSTRKTVLADDEMDRLYKAKERLDALPLRVCEQSSMTPLEHRTYLRQLEYRYGIDLAVVDYLQQMHPAESRDSKHHEVAAVAEALKDTAKSLKIPVIAPSQTNRSPDRNSGQRPGLHHLRGAGEEPADVAIGLYRPEYYGITVDEQGNDTDGRGEAIIAKQRNGPTGAVDLAFVKEHAAWESLSKHDTSDPATATNGHAGDEHPF